MQRLKPTPGDAKSDLLVVIASRLIMNGGNPVSASDVVSASSVSPADAWIARAFGAAVRITSETVEAALSRAKDHFQRAKDGRFIMKGWPLARRLECRVNEDWGAEWHSDARLGVIAEKTAKNDDLGSTGKGKTKDDAADERAPSVLETSGKAANRSARDGKQKSSGKPDDASRGRRDGASDGTNAAGKKRSGNGSRAETRSEGVSGDNRRYTEAEDVSRGSAKRRKRGDGRWRGGTNDDAKGETVAGGSEGREDGSGEDGDEGALGVDAEDEDPDVENARDVQNQSFVDPGDVASNVRFFGEARKGDVHRHRTYYDGFDVLTRKGEDLIEARYRGGDLVYCLPGSEDEDMYLAQIESVFSDPNGQWVDCAWLERGADVRALIGDKAWREVGALEHEVFLTLAVNTNAVQTIEGKCRVLTEKEYMKEKETSKPSAENPSEKSGKKSGKPSAPPDAATEVFVCRRALVGPPKPAGLDKKKKGKNSSHGSSVAGMFAPVEFEPGRGFRAVLPNTQKANKKKGKGKR